MSRPLRVVFATTYIHYPQGGGGLERNTHELCLALKARGLRPAVLCSLRADDSWLCRVNRAKRFLLRQDFPADGGLGYPVFRGWLEDGTEEVTERFGPDLAIVQVPQPLALLRAFAGRGVPGAAYVHEVEAIDDIRTVAAEGFPVLANSRFTAARLRERCAVTAEVIRPLIHPEAFETPNRPERALFINTRPRKGLEVALRLAEARPDVPFDFVTNNRLDPEPMRALTDRAHAAGNIALHAARRDMRPLYARARVLLAPSQWEEAWGRVATEAHVNGIPVLASDRGGLPESVGPGGILLSADAPLPDWLEAFGTIWDDPANRSALSRAARAYAARDEIRPEVIVDVLCHLLPRMAGDRGPWRSDTDPRRFVSGASERSEGDAQSPSRPLAGQEAA